MLKRKDNFLLFVFIIFTLIITILLITFYTGCSSEPVTVTTTKPTTTTIKQDKTPPQWSDTYPKVESISASSFTLKIKINEAGIVYYIVINNNATPPTSQQVKDQKNYGTVTIISEDFVSIAKEVEASFVVTGLSANTDYDVYVVAEDSQSNIMSSPTKIDIKTTGSDSTPPDWISGYPQTANIGSTSFDLKVKINESGKVYYAVVSNGASAPTSAQVKSGTGFIKAGNSDVIANTEATLSITGLNSNTSYDVYVVAEDNVPNLMASPTKLDVTTLLSDTTPPNWESGYPQIANIGSTSFDLKVKINESGKVYYAVVSDGSAALTSAQVKSGTGFIKAGNSDVIANTEATLSITGLNSNTSYDVYVVAEDNVPNLMASPTKLDVTTAATDTTPPNWVAGYPAFDNITRTSLTFKVEIDESGKVYYIVVDKGSTAPTSAQVKAGVNYGSVTVRASGNTTISANTEYSFNISGLEETKEYDIYAVAEDNVPNIMATPAQKTLNITPDPEWGLDSTSRTTAQKITLTVTGGGNITYTTNGSDPDGIPDANEFTYSSAITISSSITLKYIAIKTGCKPSSIKSENFPLAIGEHYPRSGDFSKVNESGWATATWPLAANYNGSDVEFAVYSKNATKVLLEIYDTETSPTSTENAYGKDARYEYWMVKNSSDNIWRAKLSNVPPKTYYAFRVWGPNWTFDTNWKRGNSEAGFITDCDTNGNRFNPNKVLFDPYTKEISHDRNNPTALGSDNGAIYGTGGSDTSSDHVYSGPATGGVSMNRRNIDTGKYAPKAIILQDDTTSFGTKPAIPQKDAIIYEAHVRGLTMHESSSNLATILSGIATVDSVPAAYRGTYKGAGYMAKYLKALGINTIELLPVHETDNDHNPSDQSGGNYWGYMTYGYFAPDRRYSYDKSPGGPTKEFKEMVKAFHDEGIEVYLDVVFNHSGEGGIWDATTRCAELTFFRGLDNSEYYCLVPGDKKYYWETTGCGNNLRCDNPPVQNLVKDSLKYWIEKMGVDGYRFDLAPVLGRVFGGTNWDFSSSASLLTDIAAMTDTYNVEMIAEAWDLGTYQVGSFPNKWGEWNGRYRDQVRRFLKGDGNTTGPDSDPKFVQVFNGDWGYFNDQGGPHKSVNFICAHDGFTLTDLVSYNNKNNSSVIWPFGPSDGGSDSNDSWNSDLNQELRRQRIRNFFTVQMFSRGVPMIVYGDEFGRTQNGNNNPYNVDGLGTYNNYNMINTDSPNAVSGGYHNNLGTDSNADNKNALFLFAKYVMNLRKNSVALRQSDYSVTYTFKKEDGVTDLSNGDRYVWIRIDGSSKGDSDYLVFINMWTSLVNYTVPAPDSGKKWVRIIDTASWAEYNVGASAYNNYWEVTDPNAYQVTSSVSYGVNAWSVVVFQEANQ